MEEEIFKRSKILYDKLIPYGFKKENDTYIMTKLILNDTFKVEVKVEKDRVKVSVYDLDYGAEYTNYRLDHPNSFAYQVKEAVDSILVDIKNKCTMPRAFISDQANAIARLIFEEYGDQPNFEWDDAPGYATFHHNDNHKWYAIIMNIDRSKLEPKKKDMIEIINVKLDPLKITDLLRKEGFYKAYHMNKKNWISLILDGTIKDQDIMALIYESYNLTKKR